MEPELVLSPDPPPRRFDRLRNTLRTALRKTGLFVGGLLTAFAALFIYNTLFPPLLPLTAAEVKDTIDTVLAAATPRPAYSVDVYQVIQPSLVLIRAEGPNGEEEEGHSLGSGVVISDQGAILTSLHVVADATRIEVIFADGTRSNAMVAVSQPEIDIAVLAAEQLPAVLIPAVMGNPNAMRVGDEAYAVGNPFGLYSSMSAGVISGFERTFNVPDSDTTIEGMIQIDTAVNPGNSGGPLLNRYGEVIGIVTGIVNPTGYEVFIGIGFAVPITAAGGAAGSPPY